MLHDLKVIAMQREGDRLYILDGLLHVLHPSTYATVWRWARGDDRGKSLSAVSSCLNDALALAEHMVQRLDVQQGLRLEHARQRVRHLIREINCAGNGLRQMRATYANDASIRASLDVLRERVQDSTSVLRAQIGGELPGELTNLVVYALDYNAVSIEDHG